MNTRWWRGHRWSYLHRVQRERRYNLQKEEEELVIKGWGYFKIVMSIITGGFTIVGLFILGYQYGQGHARAEVASEISGLQEQIRKQKELMSSAYTFEPMTRNTISLQSLSPSDAPYTIKKELLISLESQKGTPVVLIRRADDRVLLARHPLCYYERYVHRYYIPAEDGAPLYFFEYFKRGKEDMLTIVKAVALKPS